MKKETIEIKNNTKKTIIVSIQEATGKKEPDLQELTKEAEKAVKNFTDTLVKALEPVNTFLNSEPMKKALKVYAERQKISPYTGKPKEKKISEAELIKAWGKAKYDNYSEKDYERQQLNGGGYVQFRRGYIAALTNNKK